MSIKNISNPPFIILIIAAIIYFFLIAFIIFYYKYCEGIEFAIALLLAFLGASLAHYFTKKRDAEKENYLRKAENYKCLLRGALGFFRGTFSEGEARHVQKEFLESLYTDGFLYASDEVLRAGNLFLKSLGGNDIEGMNSDDYYKKMALLIRNELKEMQGEQSNLKAGEIDIRRVD